MTSIARLRDRLPFVVFVLLLILLVAVLGFVCMCMTDHPGQAVERVLQAVASLPPLVLVWALVLAALMTATRATPGVARDRASPALLQRFLF